MQTQEYPRTAAQLHLCSNLNHREASWSGDSHDETAEDLPLSPRPKLTDMQAVRKYLTRADRALLKCFERELQGSTCRTWNFKKRLTVLESLRVLNKKGFKSVCSREKKRDQLILAEIIGCMHMYAANSNEAKETGSCCIFFFFCFFLLNQT